MHLVLTCFLVLIKFSRVYIRLLYACLQFISFKTNKQTDRAATLSDPSIAGVLRAYNGIRRRRHASTIDRFPWKINWPLRPCWLFTPWKSTLEPFEFNTCAFLPTTINAARYTDNTHISIDTKIQKENDSWFNERMKYSYGRYMALHIFTMNDNFTKSRVPNPDLRCPRCASCIVLCSIQSLGILSMPIYWDPAQTQTREASAQELQPSLESSKGEPRNTTPCTALPKPLIGEKIHEFRL